MKSNIKERLENSTKNEKKATHFVDNPRNNARNLGNLGSPLAQKFCADDRKQTITSVFLLERTQRQMSHDPELSSQERLSNAI